MSTKKSPTKCATKPKAKPKAEPPAQPEGKKTSALNAAAQVLADSPEPLSTKEMVDAMAMRGLWTSPGGKTPHATLYSAILREIRTKGTETRFKKAARGKFVANK